MDNSWIFKNDAGYVAEHFFCFARGNCSELIRYEDLKTIYIVKKRNFISILFFLIFFLAGVYILIFKIPFHIIIGSFILTCYGLLLGYVFFKLPFYKYKIEILYFNRKVVIQLKNDKALKDHIELVRIVKKIVKAEGKKASSLTFIFQK